MQKLRIEDYDKIKYYLDLANYEGYNSNFVTMMMWDHEYHIEYEIHPNFMIMLQHYEDKKFFSMPFCKNEDLKEAVDYMIQYAKDHDFPFAMDCVISDVASELKEIYGDQLVYKRTPYNDDYVYKRYALETLAGKKMQKRRNHFNAFMKDHPDYIYKKIEDEDIDQVLACTRIWDLEHHFEASVQSEYIGIMYLLTHRNELDIEGGCIYIDGILQAFIIGSRLNHSTIHIPIEKANKDIRGLYVAICKFFLENNYPGYNFVNREEDMGLEYLRRTKHALHPVKMVEKYYIEENHITVAQAKDDDLEQIKNLWMTCFKDEDEVTTDFYFSTIYQPDNTYILKQDNQVLCAVQFNPYTMIMDKQETEAYFILGVSTHPDYQRQGFMRKVLNYCFDLPKYKDKPIFLQAYNWDIYRPFGFKQSHFQQKVELDVEYYKQIQPAILIEDTDKLLPLYIDYTANFDYYRKRDEDYYKNYLLPRCDAFQDELLISEKGYGIYHQEEDGITISELIYQDFNSAEAILSAIINRYTKSIVTVTTDLNIKLQGKTTVIPVMMQKDINKEEVVNHYYANEIY